jgi:hypothetical protein
VKELTNIDPKPEQINKSEIVVFKYQKHDKYLIIVINITIFKTIVYNNIVCIYFIDIYISAI